MAADENVQAGPHRTYEDLRVVADYEERPEHVTIGVIIDGAFVPIAQQSAGLVEAMKQRWNDLGGTQVKSHTESSASALEDRVAALERAALAAGKKLDKPATPRKPAAGK
jgi:hypothetical protein